MSSLLPPNAAMLTGRSPHHVTEVAALGCRLHCDMVGAFLALRDAAAAVGIDLRAASSFRDFDRQLAIWNGKFRGERPVLDRQGVPLEVKHLSAEARVEAILVWSALPGASRHHWGTDFDVYDATTMPDAAQLKLVPQEYSSSGPFAHLTTWLDDNLARYGFFRPYAVRSDPSNMRGVSPEPWHLSFAPLAHRFLSALTPALLAETLASAPIEGREVVLANIEHIHRRYVADVTPPSPESLAFELREHGRVV